MSLSRNIEYHLFGTFIQQIMLLVIGYLTFFFEVHDFTVRGKEAQRTVVYYADYAYIV